MSILVENLEMSRNALGAKWYKNPWQGIKISKPGSIQKQKLSENIRTARWLLNKHPDIYVTQDKNLFSLCNLENIDIYYQAFALSNKCSDVPMEWLDKDLFFEKELLMELIKSNRRINEWKDEILELFTDEIFSIKPIEFFTKFENVCVLMRELLGEEYLDKRIFESYLQIKNNLQDLSSATKELQMIFQRMNDAYCPQNVNFSEGTMKHLFNVCNHLLKKEDLSNQIDSIEQSLLIEYEPRLFEIDAVSILNKFKNEYAAFIPELEEIYHDLVFNIDDSSFYVPYENANKTVCDLLGCEFKTAFVFNNYDEINQDLQNLFDEYSQIDLCFTKLKNAYSPSLTSDTLADFTKMVNVCDMLLEISNIQSLISAIENTVLEECEERIFGIDVENMLDRFKTDYKSIFRIFKKQYRYDIKQLRLGYKNVKGKITNNEAIGLLQRLKERNKLLENKHAELDKVGQILGKSQYEGADSLLTKNEIEQLRHILNSVQEIIKKYPSLYILGISDALQRIIITKKTLNEAISELIVIKSYAKEEKNYDDIKSFLYNINKPGG